MVLRLVRFIMKCHNCPVVIRTTAFYADQGGHPVEKGVLRCPIQDKEVGPLQACTIYDATVDRILQFFAKVKEGRGV